MTKVSKVKLWSESSPAEKDKLIDALLATIPIYRFDHYLKYPATRESAWQGQFFQHLNRVLHDEETIFLYAVVSGLPVFLGAKCSHWDKEHFGFGVAAISVVHSHETKNSNACMANLLHQCLTHLRQVGIRFVSARINGDMIPTLHLFETMGFRYYETSIWPVAQCTGLSEWSNPAVRLMSAEDLPKVRIIAENYQYQRGHFHCDRAFDRKKVDQLYVKWIETSFENHEPIAIIEHEGKVGGYFNFKMDEDLSSALGYCFGRMRSLALDKKLRGQGLGRELFQGTIALISAMGGDYVDSGYATKNHVSARLHTLCDFYSAYEEVTLHRWL